MEKCSVKRRYFSQTQCDPTAMRGNVHIMLHSGAFVQIILQWKSNKY